MLLSLHIENMAVIRRLDVDFSAGFTVVTGETGAGKSVMMDSLKLLLGAKADKEIIRHGESYAEVSALFGDLAVSVKDSLAALDVSVDEDGYLSLLRRITEDGKSIAKINGRTVSLSALRDAAQFLLHIHGQDDTAFLKRAGSELAVLDSAAHNEKQLALDKENYHALCEVQKKIDKLRMDEGEKNRTIEMLRYQIKDIEDVDPVEGEEERLFDEKIKLKNIEKIAKQTSFAYRALRAAEKGNACYIVDRASAALRAVESVVPEAASLAARLDECYSELEDIAECVCALTDYDGENPSDALDKVETRLSLIGKITRKYGGSEAATIAFLEDARQKLSALESLDEDVERYTEEWERLYRFTSDAADVLHSTRKTAAEALREDVAQMLHALDMPSAVFDAVLTKREKNGKYDFIESGYESAEFTVAVNKGEPSVPVTKCASGGEMAHIMLALKSVIARHDGMPTVIFDEIDSGVSGKTSRKIGSSLRNSAKSSQILCITHSAQIASLADTHLLVAKGEKEGRTETTVRALDAEGRIDELSRILGGIHVTDAQREAARDMLLKEEA